MFKRAIESLWAHCSVAKPTLWQLQSVRHRVSISSFKQWKDLLVFKRYDGHHVWNLPQLKPHEYGFRRIARKPPFFKSRKIGFPKVTSRYSPMFPFNRTLQIEYNWQQCGTLYHEVHDALCESLPGVKINSLAKGGDSVFKIMAEDGRVVFDATTDGHKDVQGIVQHCYNKIIEH